MDTPRSSPAGQPAAACSPAPPAVSGEPPADSPVVEFDQAFRLLQDLVDLRRIDEFDPRSPQALYRVSVVLWLLVCQRLQPRSTLRSAVQELLTIAPDLFPKHRRVREETLSESTAAYSQARGRLSLETVTRFFDAVAGTLCDSTPPAWNGRNVFLLDGTTLTLAPTRVLRAAYPPTPNQHGPGVWPVVTVVVAHELDTAAATRPEIGPAFGPEAVSEVVLARQCLARLPAGSLILADAGYGIFSVAYSAAAHGHACLLRLSPQRFRALAKKGRSISSTPEGTVWECDWQPSPKDRQTNPWLPQDATLRVRLYETTLPGKTEPLYLLSDLSGSIDQFRDLYRRRTEVETDIRDIKVVLDLEHIRAKSPEMFRKELLTSLVAYNLVVQFRRLAAQKAAVPPRRLSFTGVWETLRAFVLRKWTDDPAEWTKTFERALQVASGHKLPNRPDRHYPRSTYHRRPKSTHFAKRHPPPDHNSHPSPSK